MTDCHGADRPLAFFEFGGTTMLAVAVWISMLGFLYGWPSVPHWPLRVIAVLLTLITIRRLHAERPFMLLSPLLLLPVVIIVFFVVGPSVYSSPENLADFRPDFKVPIERYLSGPAELIVLQFAIWCLIVCLAIRSHAPLQISPHTRLSTNLVGGSAISMLLGSVALLLGQSIYSPVTEWMKTGLGLQVLHGVPPVVSFSIAVLTWLAAFNRRWRPLALTAGIIGCAALFSLANAKTPAFVAASCLLLYLVLSPGNLKNICYGIVAVLSIIIVSTLVLAEIRFGIVSNVMVGADSRGLSALSKAVTYKLVLRQVDTAGCFSNVIERRLLAPPDRSPGYFIGAIVPRMLWPDKPNLSQGDQLAVDYCDIPIQSVYGPGFVHSASVTLLGEPTIAAGWGGLMVAQITLAIGLALATILLLRSAAVGAVTLTALLPWLVDFDQSLALYIANAVKMFFYISPAAALFVWAERLPSTSRRPMD